MGRIKKVQKIIISLIFVISFIPVAVQTQATGDIIIPDDRNYYPETEYIIVLTNLTLGDYYGLLIGANQLVQDQQWKNFTAPNYETNLKFNHFTTQQYLTNTSTEIEYLEIILYAIDSNSDTSPTYLSRLTLDLQSIKSQLHPYLVVGIISVIIISLVIFNVLIVLVKQLW